MRVNVCCNVNVLVKANKQAQKRGVSFDHYLAEVLAKHLSEESAIAQRRRRRTKSCF